MSNQRRSPRLWFALLTLALLCASVFPSFGHASAQSPKPYKFGSAIVFYVEKKPESFIKRVKEFIAGEALGEGIEAAAKLFASKVISRTLGLAFSFFIDMPSVGWRSSIECAVADPATGNTAKNLRARQKYLVLCALEESDSDSAYLYPNAIEAEYYSKINGKLGKWTGFITYPLLSDKEVKMLYGGPWLIVPKYTISFDKPGSYRLNIVQRQSRSGTLKSIYVTVS